MPVDKIEAWWHKSLRQLPWFLHHADAASVYDNSTTPRRILYKKDGDLYVEQDALPEIVAAAQEVTRLAATEAPLKTGIDT